MLILNAKPPIWDEAHKHFDIDDSATFYAYGDTIYNPAGIHVPEYIVIHEEVHMEQQLSMGVELWWQRYFSEPQFRYSQEVQAYGRQYWYFKKDERDGNMKSRYLHKLVEIMMSPMYKVDVQPGEIKSDILKWAKRYE